MGLERYGGGGGREEVQDGSQAASWERSESGEVEAQELEASGNMSLSIWIPSS